MKKSEIKIGHIYSNGKGRLRKVVDIGPQYKFYASQGRNTNSTPAKRARRTCGMRSSTTEAKGTEPPESSTT